MVLYNNEHYLINIKLYYCALQLVHILVPTRLGCHITHCSTYLFNAYLMLLTTRSTDTRNNYTVYINVCFQPAFTDRPHQGCAQDQFQILHFGYVTIIMNLHPDLVQVIYIWNNMGKEKQQLQTVTQIYIEAYTNCYIQDAHTSILHKNKEYVYIKWNAALTWLPQQTDWNKCYGLYLMASHH